MAMSTTDIAMLNKPITTIGEAVKSILATSFRQRRNGTRPYGLMARVSGSDRRNPVDAWFMAIDLHRGRCHADRPS
jgi:hypothetical protein